MAKTKREYILATCFLSGAAAIISFVALGTQEWVWADAQDPNPSSVVKEGNYVRLGLFGGFFHQETAAINDYELTMVCDFGLNICALLCGDDMSDNLVKLYNNDETANVGSDSCKSSVSKASSSSRFWETDERSVVPRESTTESERIFINSGIWICTIIFLVLSAVMGLFSAGLSIWNTVANPYQVYFSVFGLYIYNAIACFFILLAIILWGAMFAQDLINNIPCYKTFLEPYTTKGYATLGYSYWINLVSLFFYIASLCLLYVRNYLVSKEPKATVPLEDSADPAIYLY